MNNRQLSQTARIGRLEETLDRIISDPIVIKLLLMRNPRVWVDAVELLSDGADTDPEARVAQIAEQDRLQEEATRASTDRRGARPPATTEPGGAE